MQEAEKLRADAGDALRLRRDRLEALDRLRLQELATLAGVAAEQQIGIETEEVKIRKTAEAYRTQRGTDAAIKSAEILEEARQMRVAAESEAALLREEVDELGRRGRVAVREALAQKLASVPITLLPHDHGCREREHERVEKVGLAGGN